MSTETASRGAGRRTGRILLIALGLVLAGFLILQLVPVARANPPVVSEPQWDSPETRALAERACYDCHSNETVWPWYSYVAPVSWGIAREVQEGRQVINFSDWDHAGEEAREPDEMAEVLSEGEMPPRQYLAMHPAADLSDAEKQQLAQGLETTVRQDPPSGAPSSDGEGEENEGGEEHEEEDDDD